MNLMARLRCLFRDCHDKPDVTDSPILQKMRRNVDETAALTKQVRESNNWYQDMMRGVYRPVHQPREEHEPR